MNGRALLETLDKVQHGETFSIWNLLPTQASGKEWADEIKYTASRIKDYIEVDGDYSLEDIRDKEHEFANSEIETYYVQIHNRAHALSLWAMEEVQEMAVEFDIITNSLTDLERDYTYCAMRILWNAVAEEVFENTEEREEVSA